MNKRKNNTKNQKISQSERTASFAHSGTIQAEIERRAA
jgi:hypothetical protein